MAVLRSFGFSTTLAQQLDETWTVIIDGQTVQVNPNGSFRVPNVAAADQLGPGPSLTF